MNSAYLYTDVCIAHHHRPALSEAEEFKFTRDMRSEILHEVKCKGVWSHGDLGPDLAPPLDLEDVVSLF